MGTELWAPGGNHTKGKKKKGAKEIAIIAWRVGKINSPNARSIKYKGATIYYSGYNGIPSKDGTLNFGHEDIKIKGSSTSPFVVKAYAFEAGMARVTYRWTANKAACKKQQAEQKVKATTKETQHKHVKELQAKKAAEQSRKAIAKEAGAKATAIAKEKLEKKKRSKRTKMLKEASAKVATKEQNTKKKIGAWKAAKEATSKKAQQTAKKAGLMPPKGGSK